MKNLYRLGKGFVKHLYRLDQIYVKFSLSHMSYYNIIKDSALYLPAGNKYSVTKECFL